LRGVGTVQHHVVVAGGCSLLLLHDDVSFADGLVHRGSGTGTGDDRSMSRAGVVMIVAIFIVLQATNSSVVSIMSLFVTETLGLDAIWAGIALGVAAGLDIPALLLIGRLTYRYSSIGLIASGCLAGIAYYTAMVWVSHPVVLVGLQVLDARFFAVVAVVGLTVFQRIISRPGLASGLFVNTRRLGAIASGAIISLASQTALGDGGVFAASAALTVLALIAIGVVARMTIPKPVFRLSGQ
jgi:MFS transporter, SET family, sugar efflux transporter